ncbi:MAG: hypothetical protein LBD48_05125 [Treponema sp.]|nr:hypothetical protein [Treponema sp.]
MNIKKCLLAVLLPLAVIPLFARDVKIIVEDVELGLPLEGAVIRSWDGRQYVCDEDGLALVAVPDDRQVVVQAAYPGYENGRLAVPPGADSLTLGLRLMGVMEGRELVIEAARPGTSETRTGRSVGIAEREIAQTAQIGIIEDVMTSIKLLPGVGYAGFFNALPSIRGGDPGDMSAALDGFYIASPYFWGGGFSIFDPRMVQSAQLSHGVFTTRYGHTISGLLEVTAKKPSVTETELELAVSTSAANFNLSFPLSGKGGLLFMGRVTYYDPVIWLAKQIGKLYEPLSVVNSIRVAPYIRSGAITGGYRFFDNLELQTAGFWGMDGVGATFENVFNEDGLKSESSIIFDYTNYQGFVTAALSWNPRKDMLLKSSLGAGYLQQKIDGDMKDSIIDKQFSADFDDFKVFLAGFGISIPASYSLFTNSAINDNTTRFNAQARIDYDWEAGKGFVLAAGVQEMFEHFTEQGSQRVRWSEWLNASKYKDSILAHYPFPAAIQDFVRVSYPLAYSPNAANYLFTTSGYALTEYNSPGSRFGAELGLRLDHFCLLGDGFSIGTMPALNPRLNIDFNVLKNKWIVRSMDLSAGTGLFSSMSDTMVIAEKKYTLPEVKPDRSWTSVLGTKLEFPEGISFNIEGYYKQVFNRAYIPVTIGPDTVEPKPHFDGEGRIWGIDVMLQKMHSRFWDGWISYSFNWAQYREPSGVNSGMGISGGNQGDDWYFPSYHRFHNLNLVLNFRPASRINIYTRLGFASGVQIAKRIGDKPLSYPVFVFDPQDPGSDQFIEMFFWPSERDANNRTTPSLPLDIKLSFLGGNVSGKTRWELYAAVENVLGLLYTSQGNTSFNSYTGKEDTGSQSASYEIPIPIPSFGFKVSY